MRSQLIVGFVVEAFYSRILDRPVHSLNLTVGPRMVGRCSTPMASQIMSKRIGRE